MSLEDVRRKARGLAIGPRPDIPAIRDYLRSVVPAAGRLMRTNAIESPRQWAGDALGVREAHRDAQALVGEQYRQLTPYGRSQGPIPPPTSHDAFAQGRRTMPGIAESDARREAAQGALREAGAGPVMQLGSELLSPDVLDTIGLPVKGLKLAGGLLGGGLKYAGLLPALTQPGRRYDKVLGGDLVSKLGRELNDAKQREGWTPETLTNYLRKRGVKPDEMQWSGLNRWLDEIETLDPDRKLSIEEVMDNIEPLDIQEKTLGRLDTQADNYDSKFGQAGYNLPGGEDYAEELLTFPVMTGDPEIDALAREYHKLGREIEETWADVSTADLTLLRETQEQLGEQIRLKLPQYKSPALIEAMTARGQPLGDGAKGLERFEFRNPAHFGREAPNIAVHVRWDTRYRNDGNVDLLPSDRKPNKRMFIQEIQDDWSSDAHDMAMRDPKKRKGYETESGYADMSTPLVDERRKATAERSGSAGVDYERTREARTLDLLEEARKHYEGADNHLYDFPMTSLHDANQLQARVGDGNIPADRLTPRVLKKLKHDRSRVLRWLHEQDPGKWKDDIDAGGMVMPMRDDPGAWDRSDAVEEFWNAIDNNMPNRPMKAKGHELGMRRMIAKAVREGFDEISWTTGKTQTARWEDTMRQTVDAVEWKPSMAGNERQVTVIKNQGSLLEMTIDSKGKILSTDADPDHLKPGDNISKVFGGKFTKELLAREEAVGDIAGKDISIGASGMEHVYDSALVNEANRHAKKYGGKVTQERMSTKPNESSRIRLGEQNRINEAKENLERLDYIDNLLATNPAAKEHFKLMAELRRRGSLVAGDIGSAEIQKKAHKAWDKMSDDDKAYLLRAGPKFRDGPVRYAVPSNYPHMADAMYRDTRVERHKTEELLAQKESGTVVHTLKINDKMREGITKEGLPLYQIGGGLLGAGAAGGALNQTIEPQRPETQYRGGLIQ